MGSKRRVVVGLSGGVDRVAFIDGVLVACCRFFGIVRKRGRLPLACLFLAPRLATGCRLPAGLRIARFAGRFLGRCVKAGAQDRQDLLDALLVEALVEQALLDRLAVQLDAHQTEQELPALVISHPGEALGIKHVGQGGRRFLTGHGVADLAGAGDGDAVGIGAGGHFHEAGLAAFGDQGCGILLERDAAEVSSKGQGQGIADARLAGAVLAGDQRHRLGQVQFNGAGAEEVAGGDVGDFHAAAPFMSWMAK